MTETDKQILDLIHTNIHALRLTPNYKPSEFERRVALLISSKYSDSCPDCKEAELRLKYSNPKQEGFMDKLGGIFK